MLIFEMLSIIQNCFKLFLLWLSMKQIVERSSVQEMEFSVLMKPQSGDGQCIFDKMCLIHRSN